jgi:hypothetical protein
VPASLQQAFYLASSWLWCIGAFLPVLLLRDYGWITLTAFTLANVIGAAAFGWVMTRNRQPAFLARHRRMLQVFSHVTIAFQLFFVVWLSALVGWWLLPVMLMLVGLFYRADSVIGWVAVCLFILSMACFGGYLIAEPPMATITAQPGWWHTLLPLVLGFALSPYLDLTFHRALERSPNPRLSFTLGFGVFFLALLVFVFVYSGGLQAMAAGEGSLDASLLWPVIAFIVMQTAFTIAVHFKEAQRQQPKPWRSRLVLYGAYLAGLCVLLGLGTTARVPWLDLPMTELLYKGFLLFYGLVFPLYLLLGKRPAYFWGALLVAVVPYSVGFLVGGDALPLWQDSWHYLIFNQLGGSGVDSASLLRRT